MVVVVVVVVADVVVRVVFAIVIENAIHVIDNGGVASLWPYYVTVIGRSASRGYIHL